MNKNILIMCFSKSGAAPAFTLSFAKGMSSTGCNVLCLIAQKADNLEEWKIESKKQGFWYITIDTGERKTFVQKYLKLLLGRSELMKKIEKILPGGADISIQTMTHPWMVSINGWIKPQHELAIVHDPIEHSGEDIFNRHIARYGYEHTKELIVMTRSFIPVVSKIYKKDSKNIYYMRHGKYDSYKLYKNDERLVSYDPNLINFLFFGRIEKYKGIGILLKAYASIRKKYNNTSLTIAGSGNINTEWNEIINNNDVRLINRYIKDEEVDSLFTGRNLILIVPYIDATQSGVIPVAIDYDVPVIATETGGLKEQLDDGNVGVFCKPNDIESLKDAMEEFIENTALIDEQKKKISIYSSKLDWSVICKSLLHEIEMRCNL